METLIQFIPMIVILIVFYLVMMLPERKRRKKYDEMLNSLKVNDKVMTRGGVIGKIITLENDSIILESELCAVIVPLPVVVT